MSIDSTTSTAMMDAAANNDAAELQRLCYPVCNAQDQLVAALQSKNRDQFQRALRRGADPSLQCPDSESGNLSVFELCCQRPGLAMFVEDCVRNGSDVNRVNETLGAAPVNLAAESEDAANLAALLANPTVQVDHQYQAKTALMHLIAGLDDANFTRRFDAIQLLVQHQANVNIPDERGITPILSLLKARKLDAALKRRAIEMLLQQAAVDLDGHWEGQARDLLQRNYPDLQLPAQLPESERVWTDAMLLDTLRSCNEDRFVRACDARMATAEGLTEYVRSSTALPAEDGTNPMQLAIDNGLARAVEKLLRCGAVVRSADIGFDAIRRASRFGQHRIVGLLLAACPEGRARNASVSKAIADTIPHIGETIPARFAHTVDHRRCLDQLLAVGGRSGGGGIDVNVQNVMGNTPLHLAVQYKQRDVVRLLLRNGASWGMRNAFGAVAIADVDADVLEAHLDECIGESEDRRAGDDQYEVSWSYKNLVPTLRSADNSNGTAKTPTSTGAAAAAYSNNEMTPIAHIVQTRDLQHLAKHPLISSFLFLKWYRLAPTFYLNVACYSVFCFALLSYIMCLNQYMVQWRPLFVLLLIAGIVYMVVRETIKLLVAPAYFLRNCATYVSWTLIVVAVVLLLDDAVKLAAKHDGMDEQCRRTVSAIGILLSVGEFFVLLGSLPVMSLSTHLVMLMTVTRSFVKSLLLYSVMLLAFAMCFFTLLDRDARRTKFWGFGGEANGGDGGGDEDNFSKFVSPGMSIVKTVVMMTGEFDAGSISFENNQFTYAVFVMFVFLVPTVLFNLLNGLAVHDTQVIKADAELSNLVYQAKVLTKYEQIFGHPTGSCCTDLLKRLISNRINLFPDYLPCAAIKVLPNDDNRVQIPIIRTMGHDIESIADPLLDKGTAINLQRYSEKYSHLACCFGLTRFSSMEPKIVKAARALIETRRRESLQTDAMRAREATIDRRLVQIEQSIGSIVERLDRVLAKVED